MYLNELKPGQAVRIVSMGSLEGPVRRRLMAMGLLPHSEVRFLRQAPLGDPLQITTGNITLSIQKQLAMQIEVVAV
ncbi:ferrous iron transport protein A [Pseudaeromonas sharmana]|uniref:Ferrous iron transport protein A n=1 Tax=Pseudaeromonas sharmana TaxID=328412 RepID=A0ABV8CQS2_9GAMM